MEEMCGSWVIHDTGTQTGDRLLRVRGDSQRSRWDPGEWEGHFRSRVTLENLCGLHGSSKKNGGEWTWKKGKEKDEEVEKAIQERIRNVRLSYLDFSSALSE